MVEMKPLGDNAISCAVLGKTTPPLKGNVIRYILCCNTVSHHTHSILLKDIHPWMATHPLLLASPLNNTNSVPVPQN
jgi:hypothetical protein